MAKNQANLLEKIWKAVQKNTENLSKITTSIGVINSELGEVKDDVKDIKTRFVTLERFSPVEKVVYTIVGAACLAILGALIALVIK